MNAVVESGENKSLSTRSLGEDARASADLIHLVTFNLLGEEFGMPILDVREIIRMVDITPVPHAPAFVEGVINLRGQILPVIDLRKRFNLNSTELEEDTRIIVVEINNSLLGLIVDGVKEVLRIPSDSVSPPPQIVANGIGAEYIKGIAHFDEKMIILIDLKRVFSEDEMNSLEQLD